MHLHRVQSHNGVRLSSNLESMTRKKITVELVGGIGNQLFGFFAGMYVSNILGCDFVPYLRKTAKNESNHGSSLNSLNLPHRSIGPGKLSICLDRISRQALVRILNNPLANILRIKEYTKFYTSSSLGEDPNLSQIAAGSYIRGYFQTYKYFEHLQQKSLVPKVTLINPSDWFQAMEKEFLKTKPLVMHIRRGDYLRPENDFIGALSPKYFIEALTKLRKLRDFSQRPVWIFSDDLPGAKHDFRYQKLGPHKWIEEPAGSDPAETLILMGLGSGIVTSNSTFSWWAATLGQTENVVAPSPWFKDHQEPLELIHPSWKRQESQWS
jgi:hypothetical protein